MAEHPRSVSPRSRPLTWRKLETRTKKCQLGRKVTMPLQRLTGKFPTESPPDPDNGNRTTPLQAIRKQCLSCCNGSTSEVALCPVTSCSCWPFRFGRKRTHEIIADQGDTLLHPLEWQTTAAQFHAGRHSVLMAIKGKCFDCSGASKADVRNCAFADCALHPFRRGKNPNRRYRPEERVRRAKHLAKVKVGGASSKNPVSIADPQAKCPAAGPTTTAPSAGSKTV
jgi:hypothetical protein